MQHSNTCMQVEWPPYNFSIVASGAYCTDEAYWASVLVLLQKENHPDPSTHRINCYLNWPFQ